MIILLGSGNLSNANGCIKPPQPTAKDVSICGAGKTTLNATGGNGRFRWYASPTDTTVLDTNSSFSTSLLTISDTFYVAAINDSCKSERDTVVVLVHPHPVAITGKDTGVCPGNFIKLGVKSKLNTGYQWTSNPYRKIVNQLAIINDNPTVKTQYYLEITDSISGCKFYDTINVDIYPKPVADIVYRIDPDNTVNFKASNSGSDSCYWDFGDINTGTGSEVKHRYYSTGSYLIKLTVVNKYGCADIDTQVKVCACYFGPTSINDETVKTNESKISIYPNPATNSFTLSSEITIQQLTIYNTLGEMVMYIPDYQKEQSVNIESLVKGLYLVKGVGQDNREVNVKLIKE